MHMQLRQFQAQEALLKAQLEGREMEEEDWEDVMDRLDPKSEENWEKVQAEFRGFKAEIKAEFLPSKSYPDNPLLVLTVKPTGWFPTTKPGGKKYNVSICFYDPDKKQQIQEVYARYSRPRIVTLTGEIAGSTFQLNSVSPIANDPEIRNLHSTGHYKDRQLHVSM